MTAHQPRALPRHARRARAESLLANLALAIFVLLTALCLGSIAPTLRTTTVESKGLPPVLAPTDAAGR